MAPILDPTSVFALLAMLTDSKNPREILMKTSTRLVLALLVMLLGVVTLAVIGQSTEPAPPVTSDTEAELEEFVPSEQVSFDKTISLPTDI